MSYNKQLRGVSCYGLRWRKPNPLNLIWVMPAKGRLTTTLSPVACSYPACPEISTDSRGPMSITTLFESGLYGRLRQAGSHWQDYVDHPFLQQLAAGTLPERAFRRYLTRGLPVPCASPAPTRCGQRSCAPCRNARHGVAPRHRRRTAAARGLLRRMGAEQAQIAASRKRRRP